MPLVPSHPAPPRRRVLRPCAIFFVLAVSAAVSTAAPAAATHQGGQTLVTLYGSGGSEVVALVALADDGTYTNQMRVEHLGGESYRVSDSQPVFTNAPYGWCVQDGPYAVVCNSPYPVVNVVVRAGAGNDAVSADVAVMHSIEGEGGNDTMAGGTGPTAFWGGSGTDSVSYAGVTNPAFPVRVSIDDRANDGVDYPAGFADEGDDVRSDVERVVGGSGNDTLAGHATAGTPVDFGGSQTLVGGPGVDVISGGVGNDTLVGRMDVSTGPGNSGWNDDGLDVLLGGPGNDVLVDVAENVAPGLGYGDNVFLGGDGNDRLIGGIGNDALYGEGGDDTLDGGMFYAASERDVLDGGAGSDWVSYATHQVGVDVTLDGVANDGIPGTGEADNALNVEHVAGSPGVDTLRGNGVFNALVGGEGADTLYGGTGNDWVIGGGGDDALYGEGDNDTLVGGAGFDLHDAGSGDDSLNADDTPNNAETVRCGRGTDDAFVDPTDVRSSCETVQLG